MMVQILLATCALATQARIGSIGDRPMTWDWIGVVPLEAVQKPSPAQQKLFAQMRAGDYYRAYISARNDLLQHPDDLVDAWILLICAKGRGAANDLVAESASLVSTHPTCATRILRLDALNLAFTFKMKHNPTHDPLNSLRHAISAAEFELRAEAPGNMAAMVAVLGSLNCEVKPTREAARALRDRRPDSIEAAILYVRSLLRGEFGTLLATGDKSGKLIPAPHQDRFKLFPPNEPKMDDALAELSDVEKRFGKHPLVDYYRAMAYAMKAYFSDPKRDDEVQLQAKGIAAAKLFLTLRGLPATGGLCAALP